MDCSCLPYEERTARLAAVESVSASCSGMPVLSPAEERHKRKTTLDAAPMGSKRQRHEADPLSRKVDTLATEFAQIKALLLNLQPRAPDTNAAAPPPQHQGGGDHGLRAPLQEEDSISLAASDSLFLDAGSEVLEGEQGAHSPYRSESGSVETEGEARQPPGSDLVVARQAIQLALSRLGLDVPAEVAPSVNAYFRGTEVPKPFSVPSSEAFIKELHSSWGGP